VHYGRIGSGGRLINSAAERNRLAEPYRLIGFDMEGDGVSDAAYLQHVDWFMVRGVSDYGSGKNDEWHRYASLAAAAYVRVLLGEVRPRHRRAYASPSRTPPRSPTVPPDDLVDAVWAVRTMRDREGRDRVAEALGESCGVRIDRARDAYHDIENIVRSATREPGGLEILVRILWGIERDSAPLRRLAEMIE
jgi:hypothetical protein